MGGQLNLREHLQTSGSASKIDNQSNRMIPFML